MFLGHVALGLAAKRVTPNVSLALLILACQLADAIWPVLLAIGLEQVRIDPGNTAFTPLDFVSYPYSHSLLLLTIWGIAYGLACRFLVGGRGVFRLTSSLVVSHWWLDAITHRPDLPLYPGGPKVGWGLWNSIPLTLAVELTMYAAGLWIYLRATRARDAVGRWAFAALAIFLVCAYLANLADAPPSVPALYVTAIVATVVLTIWSWWADHHRDPCIAD
ncbi:MAG TPA: hypothetical protein VHI98_01735 [Vicinamibacterales bacterium]|jgi:hypothetical protein|nr:hypothetical protein [Vicinamibacterales bacterium]